MSVFGAVGTCAGRGFEAAWRRIAPSPCGALADSSSIKCAVAVGQNEKSRQKGKCLLGK